MCLPMQLLVLPLCCPCWKEQGAALGQCGLMLWWHFSGATSWGAGPWSEFKAEELSQLSLNCFLLSLSSVHPQRFITLEMYQVDTNRKWSFLVRGRDPLSKPSQSLTFLLRLFTALQICYILQISLAIKQRPPSHSMWLPGSSQILMTGVCYEQSWIKTGDLHLKDFVSHFLKLFTPRLLWNVMLFPGLLLLITFTGVCLL